MRLLHRFAFRKAAISRYEKKILFSDLVLYRAASLRNSQKMRHTKEVVFDTEIYHIPTEDSLAVEVWATVSHDTEGGEFTRPVTEVIITGLWDDEGQDVPVLEDYQEQLQTEAIAFLDDNTDYYNSTQ